MIGHWSFPALRSWTPGVELVEPPGKFPGQLDVRDLVFADWHKVRPIDEDIGSLEKRVAEKPIRAEILCAQVLLLLFVSGHPLQPAERSDHGKEQMHLSVLQDVRLNEKRGTLWI